VLGAGNLLGRIIFQVTAQVPLEHIARPRDDFGQQISPPIIIGSLVFSL
jgi:hypothetical protein